MVLAMFPVDHAPLSHSRWTAFRVQQQLCLVEQCAFTEMPASFATPCCAVKAEAAKVKSLHMHLVSTH